MNQVVKNGQLLIEKPPEKPRIFDEPGVGGVPGYYDYAALYARAIEEAAPGDWLIEIGIYHGLSLRDLAHHAKAADKNLTVVGIDWGRGSPEVPTTMAIHPTNVSAGYQGGNLASSMLATILTAGLGDDCSIILAPSVKAAKFIPDGCASFVFIDACHERDAVIADIRAFLPKVKPFGLIAGHDYFDFPGVRTAVHEVFGERDYMSRDCPSCWEVRVG